MSKDSSTGPNLSIGFVDGTITEFGQLSDAWARQLGGPDTLSFRHATEHAIDQARPLEL